MKLECSKCHVEFAGPPSRDRDHVNVFCSSLCQMAYGREMARQRFLGRVKKTDTCWLYTGQILRTGYGLVYTTPRQSAHRFAYQLAFGVIPDGLHVCHKCDVRHCVRPDHLFLGTARDNIRDAVAKNRIARGERAGNSKLTAEEVIQIRVLCDQGVVPHKIAKQFGVNSPETIRKIAKRRTWTHI